jgi:hypothetical protein
MFVFLTNPHTGETLTAILVSSLSEIRPEQKTPNAIFYQLADGNVYKWFESEQMAGIGGFFGQLMGIAAPFANLIPGVGQFVSAGLTVASGLIQGKPGQARGLAQITDFGNQVLAAFDSLAGQMTPTNNLQISAEADKLVALLSDSNAVYQAKKGKDAEALTSFKQQAQQKAAQLKAAAAELARNPAMQQGNPQAAPPNSANSGNPQPELTSVALYAVGGIAAFLLLKKLL